MAIVVWRTPPRVSPRDCPLQGGCTCLQGGCTWLFGYTIRGMTFKSNVNKQNLMDMHTLEKYAQQLSKRTQVHYV